MLFTGDIQKIVPEFKNDLSCLIPERFMGNDNNNDITVFLRPNRNRTIIFVGVSCNGKRFSGVYGIVNFSG